MNSVMKRMVTVLAVVLLSLLGHADPAEDYLLVASRGNVETAIGDRVSTPIEDYFTVESGSAETITLSGLPLGLRYDKVAGRIVGQTKGKGVSYVTCSARNRNGYQMSAMLKWTVGDADNGDYDNIGLSESFDSLDDMCSGCYFFECGFFVDSVTGLPPGVKWNVPTSMNCGRVIAGTPTKAGKYKLVISLLGKKAQKTVVVRDGGSAYQEVSVGVGSGTVAGGGVKKAGETVWLTAKPASGSYFAGWYTDADCTKEFGKGKSGDYRTAGESFVFDAQGVWPLYARFVTKSEDSRIGIDADATWNVNTKSKTDDFRFDVDSLTMPKVTAKGLPSGVKLSGTTLVIADTSKLKPGTTVVTLMAKNLSGATATRELRIVVPNLRSDVFGDLEYDGPAFSYVVGEADGCRVHGAISVAEGWTVTASGLPPGLKFNFRKDDGCAVLSGMATRAGVYTVTLTARRGRETEKATFTVEVADFPSAAVGAYGGDIGTDLEADDSDDIVGYGIDRVVGTFSMTVAKGGKISVKFPSGGKTVTLSGYSCFVTDEEISVYLSDAKENWCDLVIYPQRGLGACQVEGSFGDSSSKRFACGQRNAAKTDEQMKAMVAKLAKIGKIKGVALDGEINCPVCGAYDIAPNITFTVGSDGMVKASGKIDGRSVSGSALLQVREREGDYWLYADFCENKAIVGTLAYRVGFSWSWLRDENPTGVNALCGGSYHVEGL